MTEPKKRVAILISGRGSNMTALIEAAKAPDYPAEIVGVFANKPDAAGLQTTFLALSVPMLLLGLAAIGLPSLRDLDRDRQP